MDGLALNRADSLVGPVLARRNSKEALDWCLDEMQGVPLWQPPTDGDFKSPNQNVSLNFSEVIGPRLIADDKKINPVIKARLAVMAAWTKVCWYSSSSYTRFFN